MQVHPREPLGTMPGTKLVPDKQYSVILLLLPAVAALKHGCTLFDTPSIERWGSVSPPPESWGACEHFDQQRTDKGMLSDF